MGTKEPLYKRIEGVLPTGGWATLDEICSMLGTTSKSYIKMTLFLMPNVAWQRVLINNPAVPQSVWRWEFRKIEGEP